MLSAWTRADAVSGGPIGSSIRGELLLGKAVRGPDHRLTVSPFGCCPHGCLGGDGWRLSRLLSGATVRPKVSFVPVDLS
jgi:hypothetical protein